MRASRSAPTPTSRGRCRKVQQKRWAISWRSWCEKIENSGENDTIILSAALWTFRRVGHGVGQAGFHRFSRSAFPKMAYTFMGKILLGWCLKNTTFLQNQKSENSCKNAWYSENIRRFGGGRWIRSMMLFAENRNSIDIAGICLRCLCLKIPYFGVRN